MKSMRELFMRRWTNVTRRDIMELVEATFEFNREATFHHAETEIRISAGSVKIWVWIYEVDNKDNSEYVLGNDRASMLEACEKMAAVIAEEKAARQE